MTNSKYFTHFKQDISGIELPKEFTFPFFYRPHELSKIAANELQELLLNSPDWSHNFGVLPNKSGHIAGKMFGVLIVQNDQGEVGYLKAFSGKIEASGEPEGFVPSISADHKMKKEIECETKIINDLTDEITEIEISSIYQNIMKDLDTFTFKSATEIEKQREFNRLAKIERKAKRAIDPSLTEELNRESVHNKNVLKELIESWKIKIEKTKTSHSNLLAKLSELKENRKNKSIALQKIILDQYQFLNIKKETKGLNELFKAETINKPPAGTGDCAAPKLLQFAFANDLKPLAMAEFWWGAPHKSAIRTHKNFYPACTSKCKPLLKHMLSGITVEKNPIVEFKTDHLKIETVFEDEHMLIISKPSGLLSVPGKEIKDSVLTRLSRKYPEAKNHLIIHRLDQLTSGIVVLAKTKEAHKLLQEQFIKRTIKKKYIALLDGEINSTSGEINLPLRTDFDDLPRQMVCFEYGKPAITKYEVISVTDGKTKIEFEPLTGRTHQLRMHSAHIDGLATPIVGDTLYGTESDRLYLHAYSITFKHPISKELLTFKVTEDF